MDFKSDFVSGLKFDKLENAHEPKMWTIPSLDEEHLRELMVKFPDWIKGIITKHVIPFISNDNLSIELDNASVSMFGPNNERWKIISGHGKYEINIDVTDINDPIFTIKANDKKPEEIHCKEITKRFLGKCIIQKCGNEGTTRNEAMRKLLQVAIDRLHDEYEQNILQNARVCIYDSMERLILVSGDGRNSFVINSENGNILLRCTNSEKKKYQSKRKLFCDSFLVLIGLTLLLLFPWPFCVICHGVSLWKLYEWWLSR